MCSNYAINVSVITGSMMAASTTILQQFTSSPVIYIKTGFVTMFCLHYVIIYLNSSEWHAVTLYYNHIWLFYYMYNREAIKCSVVFWINSLYTFSLYLPYMCTATPTNSFVQKILLVFVNLTIRTPVYVYLFKTTCVKLAILKYWNFTFVFNHSFIQLVTGLRPLTW